MNKRRKRNKRFRNRIKKLAKGLSKRERRHAMLCEKEKICEEIAEDGKCCVQSSDTTNHIDLLVFSLG
jgi:hypothetical protein